MIFEHNGTSGRDSVRVTGTGVPSRLSFFPTALAFGNANVGASGTRTVTVALAGPQPIQVTQIISRSGPFGTTTAVPFTVNAGTNQTVTATFTPPAGGTYDSYLVFVHNGPSGRDSIRVTGTGVPSRLAFSPTALAYGNISLGTPTPQPLTVSLTGVAPIQVTRVFARNPAFTTPQSVPFGVVSGTPATLSVVFNPPAGGTYSSYVVFEHTGESSRDSILVTGSAALTGLAFTPSSLTFATTGTGTPSAPQNVRAAITGPGSQVVVSSVYTRDPAFRVAPVTTPVTVTSASPLDVAVTFSPTVAGAQSGWVYFAHNGSTGLDSVRVTGTGQFNARLTPLTVPARTANPNFVNLLFRATAGTGTRGLNIPADYVAGNPTLFQLRDGGTVFSPTGNETFYQVSKLGDVPYRLRTVLMIDNSASVGNDLAAIKAAARTIVDNLGPSQDLALYVFSGTTTLVRDFTSNRALLYAAIDGITLGESSTAFNTSVITGLGRWTDRFVITDQGGGNLNIDIERGYLIVLSDGIDTAGGPSDAQVLAARGGKLVFTVGYGSVNTAFLTQLGNGGFFPAASSAGLPAQFAAVRAEIENDTQSFYFLNYASPRRTTDNWNIEVCLSGNAQTGTSACATSTYNSTGFTGTPPVVYINRTAERLFGATTVNVTDAGTVLTATTILGRETPVYAWSTSDPSQVTVAGIAGTNQAIATRVGPIGGMATVTVTDTANMLSRSVSTTGAVPGEETPGRAPAAFAVTGVYPNPARDRVQVDVEVPSPMAVRVEVYDVLGRSVLVAGGAEVAAGLHGLTVDTRLLPPGLYVVRVTAGAESSAHRITVVR